MSSNKPRILCLHGGGSNSDITGYQTIGLRLHQRMECVYLDAPHVMSWCYPGLDRFSDGPFRAWADPSQMLTGRGDQWEASLEHLARFCEERGPFDGVYGFSQGTALITNMSSPAVWRDRFKMERCPWRFAILACGGASGCIRLPRGTPVIDIPSFIILGKKDMHYSDGKVIAQFWDQSRQVMHTHDRGHEIDMRMYTREGEMIAKLNDFLDAGLGGGGSAEKEGVG